MFEALLKDETASAQWDTFFVVDNHWPADGCLETYKVHASLCSKNNLLTVPWANRVRRSTVRVFTACVQGIVVTGSASDSFGTDPWIVRLRDELAAAVRRRQRILGVCFGCQILAIVLGGSAGQLQCAGLSCTCQPYTQRIITVQPFV